jgi:hypothetical protein
MQFVLWTFTSEYAEVIVNGTIVKAPIYYLSNKPCVTINGTVYEVNLIEQGFYNQKGGK